MADNSRKSIVRNKEKWCKTESLKGFVHQFKLNEQFKHYRRWKYIGIFKCCCKLDKSIFLLLFGNNYLFVYLFIHLVCLLYRPWWLQTTMTKFGPTLREVWITCVLIVPMREGKGRGGTRFGPTPGTASPLGRALSSLTTASFSNCGGTDLCPSVFSSHSGRSTSCAPQDGVEA